MVKKIKKARKKQNSFFKKYGNKTVEVINCDNQKNLVKVGNVFFFSNHWGKLIDEKKVTELNFDYWQKACKGWHSPVSTQTDLDKDFVRNARTTKFEVIRILQKNKAVA